MRALILGAYGQDGMYLSQHLIDLGWPVLATGRLGSRVANFPKGAEHRMLDVRDDVEFSQTLCDFEPDAVFNLAAVSSVAKCWVEPEVALHVNGTSVCALLERTREYETRSHQVVRFVQAGSSEMFGGSREPFVSGSSTPVPVSPYGLSKSLAHQAVQVQRHAYGAYRANAVMYNHESPLRPEAYLTRKISTSVARIALGLQDILSLQNLDVMRDWGHAREYAEGLARIAQGPEPGDFVLASGRSTSVEQLLSIAFQRVGIKDWRSHVVVSGGASRPTQPAPPPALPEPSWQALNWRPFLTAEDVITEMVEADLVSQAQ